MYRAAVASVMTPTILVWRTATVCPTMYAAVAAQGVLTIAPACCVVPDVLQATPAVGTVGTVLGIRAIRY